mmetsp:Transcript_43128/g.100524  ORF Transcript_43128/g.100524 Transcript_43128/m.100524 type:complete len:271 (-) Transcript_43128:1303-2115(-)
MAVPVDFQDGRSCGGSVTALQMHPEEGVHRSITDGRMTAPDKSQDLVEGSCGCWYTSQPKLDYHPNGLGDIRGGTRREQAAQPSLSRVQQLYELNPLGVAFLHPQQCLALLLTRLLFGAINPGCRKVLVNLPRNAHICLCLSFHPAPLLRLLVGLVTISPLLVLLFLCTLQLRKLFSLELVEAVMDLIKQLLSLCPLIASSLQCRSVGVELDQCPDQLHCCFPGHARRVLHTTDRELQHSRPLLPWQSRIGRKARQRLQHTVPDPHALVQ